MLHLQNAQRNVKKVRILKMLPQMLKWPPSTYAVVFMNHKVIVVKTPRGQSYRCSPSEYSENNKTSWKYDKNM